MTTAEKLVKIAENEQKVYEAGQKSMVDESKIIEKTVSGSVISIDDVSEVPHEVSVQLSNSDENLFPYPYNDTTKTSNGITFTDNGDRSITISGVATADAYFTLVVIDFGTDRMWNESPSNNDYYVSGCKHFFYNGNNEISSIVVPSGTDYTTPITVNPVIKRVSEDFSGVAVNVFRKNIFSNVVTASVANALTNINSTTYSLTPNMADGKMYGIRADVSTLPLEIGDVLKCSVKSISKIGATYGWRVEYQDGTYNRISNSLNTTFTIDKPFKALLLYCDMGTAGFSYEPIVFTDVVVYKESDVTKYTANSDGNVNVKSISPYMTIITDTNGVNITATYHKSWGMQTEYDRFWDTYQQNGNRTDYQGAFYGAGWDNTTFKPKYDIKPIGRSSHLVYDTKISGDLVAIFEAQGITLDTSGVTRMQYAFAFSELITRIGELNFTNADTSTTYVFNGCYALETVDNIIVTANTVYTYWFDQCRELKEIRFEGVIGKSLDLHWSTKLSTDSLRSIIEHLGGTASATLTLPSKFNTTEYADIIASKPSNWTIAYL